MRLRKQSFNRNILEMTLTMNKNLRLFANQGLYVSINFTTLSNHILLDFRFQYIHPGHILDSHFN